MTVNASAPVTVIVADVSTLTDWAWACAREDVGAAVRVLRGRKMDTTQGFYDEIAAALQFPYYFGENLNALDECLRDLEWLPADRYVLVVRDAAHVLSAEDAGEAFDAWIEILGGARESWGGHRFSVVMHATPDDATWLRERLSSAQAAFDEREIA
jgi:RNAse (barnase) inhibitor barstar